MTQVSIEMRSMLLFLYESAVFFFFFKNLCVCVLGRRGGEGGNDRGNIILDFFNLYGYVSFFHALVSRLLSICQSLSF